MDRRKFIQNASLSTIGVVATASVISCENRAENNNNVLGSVIIKPIIIATWRVPNATAKAWEVLQDGGTSLDAVEQGCMIEEADVKNASVGKGGLPDRDGNVTLDACIMDKNGDYGAVMCVQNITHVISLARKVMEETPHVMLAGKALRNLVINRVLKKKSY